MGKNSLDKDKTKEDSGYRGIIDYDVIFMCANVEREMHSQIRSLVDELKEKGDNDALLFILHTGGGDPMSAYRTMKLLNARYSQIYCLVPDISMSAGTLMTLGGTKIGMFADSCLGPLDLQISHPDPGDDSTISTLDVRDTASATSFEASRVAIRMLARAMQDGLPRRIAERMATEIASTLYCPIMEKIDSYHMHESIRNAELSTKYATRLLQMKMLSGNKQKAISISSTLANDYSYHGYAITLDEAREIGLEVFDLSTMPVWKNIQPFYETIQSGDIIGINSNDINGATNEEEK